MVTAAHAFPEHIRLSLYNFKVFNLTKAGETFSYEGLLGQHGLTEDIRVVAEVTCNGQVLGSFSYNIVSSNTAMWVSHELPIPASFKPGIYNVVVRLKEEGSSQYITSEGKVVADTMKVSVYNQTMPRQKYLIEHFSHLNCGYCPAAIRVLDELVTLRNDVAWVSFHGQLPNPDVFTVDGWRYIATLNGLKGYPTAILNRSQQLYVQHNNAKSGAQSTSDAINKSNVPSLASIKMEASYDKEHKNIHIKVQCEAVEGIEEVLGKTCLSVYLTEDRVQPYGDSWGYGGSTLYNRIFRAFATESPYGAPISWDGNKWSAEFDVPAKEGWKLKNMRAVAFVSREASSASTALSNLEVTNAEEVCLKENATTGITEVRKQGKTEVARYNSMGKKLDAPQRGLNIVKYADGTTEKQMLK